MAKRTLGLLLVASLFLTACGYEPAGDVAAPTDPGAPILQIRSEGGFVPVEWSLGRGPTYTLLAGGDLIFSGPVVAIYPGPLLPNNLIGPVTDEQMDRVLALVEEIGLPDMTDESDEENGYNVADATTEVVTYWDDAGLHTYSVYALGIEPQPANPSTAGFLELITLMDQIAATVEPVPYQGEEVRIIAGIGFVDPEFADIRDWPLDETDFSEWTPLPNEWMCKVHPSEILEEFQDATQTTQWTHPDPMMDAPPFTLLVRPLHPGEPPCPGV